LFFLLLLVHYQNTFQLLTGALFLVVSIINTGAMLEQKKWIFDLEYIRLGLAGIYVYSFYPSSWVAAALLVVMSVALIGYKTISNHYYSLLYDES
jgi:alkylglycerol monooxygenase